MHLPLVDDHAAGERVCSVVNHLGGLRWRVQAVTQLQQFAQSYVFLGQLLRLVGLLRHHDKFLGGSIGRGLGRLQRLEVTRAMPRPFHRLQHEPLHGVQHRANRLAHRPGDLETGVGHHEEQGQGAEGGQTRQGRRALLEQRGRTAL